SVPRLSRSWGTWPAVGPRGACRPSAPRRSFAPSRADPAPAGGVEYGGSSAPWERSPREVSHGLDEAIQLFVRGVARASDAHEPVRPEPQPFDDGRGVEIAVRGEEGALGESSDDFVGPEALDGKGHGGRAWLIGGGSIEPDAFDPGESFPEARRHFGSSRVDRGHAPAEPLPAPESIVVVERGEEVDRGRGAGDPLVVLGPGLEALGHLVGCGFEPWRVEFF